MRMVILILADCVGLVMLFSLLGLLVFVCDRGWRCVRGRSGDMYKMDGGFRANWN